MRSTAVSRIIWSSRLPETVTAQTKYLENLWDEREAAKLAADPLELLRYRSNLLGADLRITNFGGGNTSSKFDLPDPLTGAPVRVMAVKALSGDAYLRFRDRLLGRSPHVRWGDEFEFRGPQ